MAKGPLVVSWGDWTLDEPQAGALSTARVTLANDGTVAWRDGIRLAYHWLDDRGNPIVWDGIRTPLPRVEPGETATVTAAVRAPIPPGRYRLALDLVAEHRAWFSELGSAQAARDLDVAPRRVESRAILGDAEPGDGWAARVAAAHAEGFAVVAGAVEWHGALLHRRPRELEPYAPGPGRVPGFSFPLVCPSIAAGVELQRVADVAGLPAFAAPADEPWVYDGRVVVRARPRSGRRPA